MSISDQNKNLQEVLDASKKAIIRADEALSKYKNIFDNTEIDPEKLMHYLKKNYGPQVEKDIDEAVNDLMEDIFQEADQIIQHNKQIKKNTLVHRRLRNLI